MWYLFTIVIAVIGVTNVNGDCKTCNAYGFACVNSNQFQMCEGAVPNGPILGCPEGYICTDLGVVCAHPTNAPIACTDSCNVCTPGNKFACTSRTTYAICNGGELTSGGGTCPDDSICDNTTPPAVCVPNCDITSFVCDKPAPTPPPTPTTSTPTPSPSTPSTPTPSPSTPSPTPAVPIADQICAAHNSAGRFPYPNDNACIKYVYCRYVGSSLLGVESYCPTNQYFNKNIQDCQATKPAGCI